MKLNIITTGTVGSKTEAFVTDNNVLYEFDTPHT